ncbi:MAG: cytochrome c maturation protein CcmE [Phycisphaerae bacterium]|nr:cytochrome c maturation protein CcmE [Phycisphaerae bacterium]
MKTKTIVKVLIGILVIGGGTGYFMYQAMQSSWSYYYSVDDFSANSDVVKDNSLRITGKVKDGSIVRDINAMDMTFTIAGSKSEVPVEYKGTVPDNFAEGIEVVVEGRMNTNAVFDAETLMTRCESKYKAKVE